MADRNPDKRTPSPDVEEAWPDDVQGCCERFEKLLNDGGDAAIEDVICGWAEPERSKLLSELIRVEAAMKFADDEDAARSHFNNRFRQDIQVVEEALGADQAAFQTLMVSCEDTTLAAESTLEIQSFLARGGLGEVYIGEDQQLRREAAVKLIREDLSDNTTSCDQFRFEAEVTGRLAHPGIPSVYAIGVSPEGRLYYAMQYVRGTRLDRLILRHHKFYAKDHRSPASSFSGKSVFRWYVYFRFGR